METDTILTTVTTTFLCKLLGPTACYLGDKLKTLSQKGVENLRIIFNRAEEILGEEINRPGSVHPRVLKEILYEGSFCDDSLTVEYFSGLLASSYSEISRDDRAVSFLKLVETLSNYQIRTHYVFYSILKHLINGKNIQISTEVSKLKCYIPFEVYTKAMSFSQIENPNSILSHSTTGLVSKMLVFREYVSGSIEHINRNSRLSLDVKYPGVIFTPSELGVELFLWIHGLSNIHINQLTSKDLTTNANLGINIQYDETALFLNKDLL